MSTFFGAIVSAKKPTAVVPRPHGPQEPDEALHLSTVCIPASSELPLNSRISLFVKIDDAQICLATLKVGHTDTVGISVLLDEYAELSVTGHKSAELHVSGYYAPQNTMGECSSIFFLLQNVRCFLYALTMYIYHVY